PRLGTHGTVYVLMVGSNGIQSSDIVVDPLSLCDSSAMPHPAASSFPTRRSSDLKVVFSSAKTGKVTGNATVAIPKSEFGTLDHDVGRATNWATATIDSRIRASALKKEEKKRHPENALTAQSPTPEGGENTSTRPV